MPSAADLDALWREHRRFVAAVLLAQLPRGTELEDLLQDVAMNAVAHVSELRDPTRARSWLRTIALNVAASHGRRQVVRQRVMKRLDADADEPADPHAERAASAAAARALQDRVLDLAHALPPQYREPLLLKSVEGLSQRAIAEALDLPETTIETRLVRARVMLRSAAKDAGLELPENRSERAVDHFERSRP